MPSAIIDRLIWAVVGVLVCAGIWAHGFSTGGSKELARSLAFQNTQIVVVEKKVTEQRVAIEKQAAIERVKIEYRDKYIPVMLKETEYVVKELVTCPVHDDAVRLWNKIRACSLQPSEAGCSADGSVPDSGSAG